MKTLFKNLLCILGATLFLVACNNDDDGDDLDREAEAILECEEAFANFESGVVCCTYGPGEANAGQTLEYTYVSTRQLDSIGWEVISGNMSVVSEDDTAGTAQVSFDSNFDGGLLIARGFSPAGNNSPLTCSDSWEITLD
ncbi:hypothetical protein [Croceiramulus getboli]|nr:hypothetical protein P8624_07320 [Flavobacteriaceae bacterium YJPT1-3]